MVVCVQLCVYVGMCGEGVKVAVCRVRLCQGEYFWKGMQMLTVNVAAL